MTANVNFTVVCGFTNCPWSMEIDRLSGADPMAVHQMFLDHLDEHDLADEQAECETCEQWVNDARAIVECSTCHATPGQPHTEYCKRPQWEAHDAEVARALAEDKTPGGIYAGQIVHRTPDSVHKLEAGCCLYAGDTTEQIAAEQARIDRFMAGDQDQ